jgi:hypothetical protein
MQLGPCHDRCADALDWHLIFLVNVPVGILVVILSVTLIPAARIETASRRLDVAGAVTVTAALMLAVYAIVSGNEAGWGTARTLGLLAVSAVLLVTFLVIESRVESPLMPLPPVPSAEHRRVERRRRPLGRRDVRVVLPLRALHAARPRVQPARGRPSLPACEPHHGRPLDRALREARHALRHQAAARDRARLRRARPPALRARSGGRDLGGRRAPRDDPPRPRRWNGVQPGAPRRDERRRAVGGRPRVGRRQHVVHEGRGARARRPCEPRRRSDRQPTRLGRERGGGAHGRLPRRVPGRRLFAAAAAVLGGLLLRQGAYAAVHPETEREPTGEMA